MNQKTKTNSGHQEDEILLNLMDDLGISPDDPLRQNLAFNTKKMVFDETLIPEIHKAIQGNFNDIPGELKKILAQGTAEVEVGQNHQDQWKVLTYVNYVPRMFMDAMKSLPENPDILVDAEQRMAKLNQPWPEDDKIPVETLRDYGRTLIDNFMKSAMLLPPNMQMVCINNFCKLADEEETKHAMRPFEIPGRAVGSGHVVREMLMHNLLDNVNNINYKRLRTEFENTKKSVMEGPGI